MLGVGGRRRDAADAKWRWSERALKMDNALSAVQGCVSGWLTAGNEGLSDTSDCIRYGEGCARYPIGAVFFLPPPPRPALVHIGTPFLFNFYTHHHTCLLLTSGIGEIYIRYVFSAYLHASSPVICLPCRLACRVIMCFVLWFWRLLVIDCSDASEGTPCPASSNVI